jgi:hypothetical protein
MLMVFDRLLDAADPAEGIDLEAEHSIISEVFKSLSAQNLKTLSLLVIARLTLRNRCHVAASAVGL